MVTDYIDPQSKWILGVPTRHVSCVRAQILCKEMDFSIVSGARHNLRFVEGSKGISL